LSTFNPFEKKSGISTARVLDLATRFTPEKIAQDLGLSEDEVISLVEGHASRQKRRVMLRDNKTGVAVYRTTWRKAYFHVCMEGLTDWDWWSEKTA
jgi:hypothetical protein